MMIIIIKAFLIFITTLLGTIYILPKLMHIASTFFVTKEESPDIKYSLMDSPDNKRKVHDIPKPLVGGIGMLIVVSLSSILFVPPEDLNLRGYYSAVIILGITGVLDDFKELHHNWKFVMQILAVAIMLHYSDTALISLGNLLTFGSINIGIFAIAPVTIFCTVGVVNAINMIDGLDGLAGGIALVSFIAFAFLAYHNQQMNMLLLSISLCGAVIGFLRYNWYPSKLFMGDAGSFFLGFSLAFLAIYITQKHDSLVPPVAALLVLTVPIVDTLTVMVRRLIRGKNPFSADKNHLHHILLQYGLSVKSAVIVILCLCAGFSLLGIVGTLCKVPEYYLFFVFFSFFILYYITTYYAHKN
ncbi:MAG: MraY family glycosyltransferase [Thermodesulfovibrionia bacterium]|nr:MraY family glycosyltransferase [Thermodesulfovibrionia bacterium]